MPITPANLTLKKQGRGYKVNGEKVPSVTSIVNASFPRFNPQRAINGMRSKPESFARSVYANMSDKQIKDQWQSKANRTSKRGTQVHKLIERYLSGKEVNDDSIEYMQFLDFARDFGLTVQNTATEVRVTNGEVAGTIDCIVYNEDGTITIIDWKCSPQAHDKRYWGRNSLISKDIPDTKFHKHELQLNLYRVLLEACDYDVRDMILVALHPDLDAFKVEYVQTRPEADRLA